MNARDALTLQFLGAAGTVTGSRYLLSGNEQRLLVDCGLFQGYKNLREMNWRPFPVAPDSIDAIVLTHAHLDHSGYLPVLVAQGFSGPVYCSKATLQLCEILLLDAAHLQVEEANYRNRKGTSRHKPALPLFTVAQAQTALQHFEPVPLHREFKFGGSRISLHPNGHILGSCSIDITMQGRQLSFTGDVGRSNDLQMPAPEPLRYCDYLVTESTYGDRLHPDCDTEATIAELVSTTAQRGGSILIPSFAVGRAQLMIHILSKLRRAGRIPPLAIYLDSPMAIAATRTMRANRNLSRHSAKEFAEITEDVTCVETTEQSKALGLINMPVIIISASGMATGGRVLHHLKRMLPNYRNTVMFAGYQAGGTRGADLVAGKPDVKIHGRAITVQAQVESLQFLSAHADYRELIELLRSIPVAPKRCFITHGEVDSAAALQQKLQDELGWQTLVPELGELVEL